MANPLKGESRLEIGNVIYTLVFSIGTIISIEEKLGKGFPRIISEMTDPERMSFTALRAMLWAALREKHKEITLEDAGDMIIGCGGYGVALGKVLDAFRAAFPSSDETDENPQEPSQAAGIGSAS
jgi:hypothetical protein